MATVKIYTEDLQIARALINRDQATTTHFFYKQCYPLFKSIFDNYYTDCNSIEELINDMYIVILAPSKITGKCQMENFRGESTLTNWVKTALLYHCYNKYEKKEQMPRYEGLPENSDKDDEQGDRNDEKYGSIDLDFDNLNREDVNTILNMMPNKRYSSIIRMIYLEQKTYEETAEALDMSINNFYNKHLLAKEQYERILRKEARK